MTKQEILDAVNKAAEQINSNDYLINRINEIVTDHLQNKSNATFEDAISISVTASLNVTVQVLTRSLAILFANDQ